MVREYHRRSGVWHKVVGAVLIIPPLASQQNTKDAQGCARTSCSHHKRKLLYLERVGARSAVI